MRGSVFITVKFTVIIMIIMVIITAINTVISFRDLSRWSCDHRCTGVSSIMLQLHYKVMTSVCGLLEGISASGGGTRVLIYLVRDVVVY